MAISGNKFVEPAKMEQHYFFKIIEATVAYNHTEGCQGSLLAHLLINWFKNFNDDDKKILRLYSMAK